MAEIILNLWYIHDDAGFIYSLRARAYVGNGSDEDKMAQLHRCASTDHLIARVFPIPECFHIEIEEGGKRRRLPVAPREFLNGLDSSIALWEDAIKQIEAELPAQSVLDESGRLYSGRRMLRLARKEETIEVVETTWALIITFLTAHGWHPSESANPYLTERDVMSEEDALALADTGKEILIHGLKDPRGMQVRFSLEDLAVIVDFAASGAFRITRLPQM